MIRSWPLLPLTGLWVVTFAVLAIFFVRDAGSQLALSWRHDRTNALVTADSGGILDHTVALRYQAYGQDYRAAVALPWFVPAPQVGARIEVDFDPAAPGRVRRHDSHDLLLRWVEPVWLLVAAAALSLALWRPVLDRRRRASPKK